LELHDKGKLKEFLKTRNHHGLENGEEVPLPSFQPILKANEEISNSDIPQLHDELEDSSEEELQEVAPNNT